MTLHSINGPASTPSDAQKPPFPLAIVGIGCRFPGAADDVDSFWRLLAEARSGIREIPPNRWDCGRFYHADGRVPGTMVTRWGGFVDNLDRFDAQFWGISPREAMRMDPQQRWLLEVAWEALEDAGAPPSSLRGAPVGVFVGIAGNDYAGVQMPNHAQADMHTVSGCTLSIASNRISYLLDLRGPSLSVDTACSSSLVAVWNACRSIWSGCCTAALVGGVNAVIVPDATIGFSKASMLSPTGQCFAFDARANGYVRGEGAGAVYIKPLDRAVADGDRIYAVIRAAVTNQDGHTTSMTVPSADGQAALLRQAYRDAGVAPADVAYVEAHGTGTPVGDPIEATALGNVLGNNRSADQPCLIGSVKSNIGHLEAGSGMAGLIKAALVLHHDTIPPNQNFQEPSPHIQFDSLRLKVVDRPQPLPRRNGHAPVAGVNSFGFGGANAHVVMEQAPRQKSPGDSLPDRAARPYVVPISARDPAALRAYVRRYCRFLAGAENDLAAVCYTAGARREHHEHRLVVMGDDARQLRHRLEQWLSGAESIDGVVTGQAAGARSAPVFVYTGQGTQWWAMGRQLLDREPVFRRAVEEIDQRYQPLSGHSIIAELTRSESESNIDRTDIAQPAIFALQVGLTALWQSWGIRPAKVIGHSVGEVAAAYAAGVYSLADAVRVIYQRSRLQHTTYGRGRMVAVGISADEAEKAIAEAGDQVNLAVLNSPHLVTLAGDAESLQRVVEQLEQQGKFVRWIRVPYAFHTHQMDEIEDELLESLAGLAPRAAKIPLVSTVTGGPLEGEALDATYWWKNVRDRVLFAPAIARLIQDGSDVFLEVGAHPALASSLKECLDEQGREGAVFHSLKRETDESHELIANLAALHAAGISPDWAAVAQHQCPPVKLPRYPWQRETFWLESTASRQLRLAPQTHPYLQRRIAGAQPTWEVDLHPRRFPYLNDHRFWDTVVVPAACFAEIGAAVGRALFPEQPQAVEELVIEKAMFLTEEQQTAAQVVFDAELKEFRVFSSTPEMETWELHAHGRLVPATQGIAEGIDLEELRRRLPDYFDHDVYYEDLAESGYQFGENFQQVQNVWRTSGEGLAEIVLPEGLVESLDSYCLHPAVLDAAFHIFRGLNPQLGADDFFLPQSIRQVHLESVSTPPRLWAHGRLMHSDDQSMTSDIDLYDEQSRPVAQIRGFRVDRAEQKSASGAGDECLYQFRWEPGRLHGGEVIGSCHFPGTTDVVSAARSSVEEDYRRRGLADYYQKFAPRLDALSRQAVLNAWLQLGWQPQVGDCFTADQLIDRLGVHSSFHRLLRAQLEDLSEHGWLSASQEDRWEILRRPEPVDTAGALEELISDYPLFAAEAALHQQTGPKLAGVLTGERDPTEALFPDGSAEMLERFYVEARDFPLLFGQMRQALDRLLSPLPEQRVLRVLEIGAGTGSLTREVLPLLPADRTEYLFTDIGPTFVNAARKQFADCPFIDYQIFDIERDPASQGLDPGSFDLVLGSLVVHATADLKQTIANLRRCLAPDGMLLLLEFFPHRPAWNNIFGLLEGWWRFADAELRPRSPLLEQDRWLDLLRECGLVDPAVFGASVDQDESEMAFLCAQEPAEQTVDQDGDAGGSSGTRYVVFTDGGGVGEAICNQLQQNGHRAVRVRPGAQFDQIDEDQFVVAVDAEDDLRRLFAGLGGSAGELGGVIHCWSLDLPPIEQMSLEELWAAQQKGVLSGLRLIRALSDSLPRRICFVSRGLSRVLEEDDCPGLASAPLAGLLRVANNELFPSRFSLIDVDTDTGSASVGRLFKEVTAADEEPEVAYRGECRYVRRLQRVKVDDLPVPTRNAVGADGQVIPYRLQTDKPGILSNLSLNETFRREPGPQEIEIRVRAGGINFRDVLKALGTYPGNTIDRLWFGDDVAGTVERVGKNVTSLKPGDEVAGLAPYAFQAFVNVDSRMVFSKPSQLSFPQAATLPTVFLTAHWGLIHLARMQPGESILIHAGTGGVGQAAIQIARHLGLTIFATAGTPQKRELLQELGADHVMNSRTLAFAEQIREITEGRGVDAVLNSLAGDFIPKSLSILAPYGRFLEIGKIDIYNNSKIGLEALRNNISYFVIDVAQHVQIKPQIAARLVQELQERFESGDYRPLRHEIFPIGDVAGAFRYMAQGKHVGKNVLSFQETEIPIGPCTDDEHRFRADATYLITGGASGFGLELAKWLSQRGARHIALLSRSGPRDEAARHDIEQLRAAGIDLLDLRGDVTRPEDVDRALETIRSAAPPLKGVIHAAMVVQDAFIASVDEDQFVGSIAPKMAGAWNLHTATLDLPLEHFICLSSFSCVIGMIKQSNYNAGNYFLDALAHYRRARGLPGLTISWGALRGAGFVERNRETADFMSNIGLDTLSIEDALEIVSQVTLRDAAHIGASPVDWQALSKVCPMVGKAKVFESVAHAGAATDQQGALSARLQQTAPEARAGLIEEFIAAQVAGVFGVMADKVDRQTPLTKLGLDSLMALELTVRLEREAGTKIPMSSMLGGTNIRDLAQTLLRLLDQSGATSSSPEADGVTLEPAPTTADLQAGDDQYFRVLPADETERLLAETTFEGAAIAYLPEKMLTVGGLADEHLALMFGRDPFISHYYETEMGRIAIITLPYRSHGLFQKDAVRKTMVQAIELAGRYGARCVSLTGLIPSLTDYGRNIAQWLRGSEGHPRLTTGHATTSAAVIHNLQRMLASADRDLRQESLAVLGLGSIGQSCLRLLLDIGPHPKELILCDVFDKQQAWQGFADEVRDKHGYRGPIQLVLSHAGAPQEIYAADTILTAVSVPNVLDVSRLRPGTLIVDDSYPSAFPIEEAMQRLSAAGDILFSNAGMLCLPAPIRETVLVPGGAAGELMRFGVSAFREEVLRHPCELTACVLSSLLTARPDGSFPPTLGLAGPQDLARHYYALAESDITAARPQCDKYFIEEEAVERFRRRFGGASRVSPQ